MSVPIRSIALDPQGRTILLRLDGAVYRQVRIESGSGSYPMTWEEVPTDTLPGRATQVQVKHDGRLVALTAAGELFELAPGNGFGNPPRWKIIELPQ
jgi:hypothetical protein